MPHSNTPSKPQLKLNLIGAGRVGQTLAHLATKSKAVQVQDVLTTSLASAQAACTFIGEGRAVENIQAMRPADLWMIATPDAQIGEATQALAACIGATPTLVFHCSGALSSNTLEPLRIHGALLASAHPILSFATPSLACMQWAGTPCALEGDEAAIAVLEPLLTNLGAHCFEIQREDKLLYHAGAVFATNFLPVLQSVAEAAWKKAGVPDDIIQRLRASLLANAVNNIVGLGPHAALTGPAARGDLAAIARQSQAVSQWDAQAGEAYSALSALGLRLAGH
jgi:predicted short-subunit dehydrogenase-like oxidoreductase (DUF2520 family)